MPRGRVNDQAVKKQMLLDIAKTFNMAPNKGGGPMAWGYKVAGYVQGSSRIEDGKVTDVRISNNENNTWNDQLVKRDGASPFVRCQLPANGPVIQHVLNAFTATSGHFVTFRLSIFESSGDKSIDYYKQARLVRVIKFKNDDDVYAEIEPVA